MLQSLSTRICMTKHTKNKSQTPFQSFHYRISLRTKGLKNTGYSDDGTGPNRQRKLSNWLNLQQRKIRKIGPTTDVTDCLEANTENDEDDDGWRR